MKDRDDILDLDKLLEEMGFGEDDDLLEDELTVPSRETLEEYLLRKEEIVIHISKDDE